MLASRERAAGGAARAALLRRPDAAPSGPSDPAGTAATVVPPIRGAGVDAVTAPLASATATAVSGAGEPPMPAEMDTLARLREAKKRARGG